MTSERPSHLSEEAVDCLRALADAGLGRSLSLGGAVGLMHYVDYRSTQDIDAWWNPTTTPATRERILSVVEEALSRSGEVRRRSWGDVIALDLRRGGKVVFSFQVADRSAQLEPPAPASWVDILLDSLADLIASKMVALVERGAPRDFRDVHAVCHAGATTPRECWDLWRRRQIAAGSDTDAHRARLAVETHLQRIEQHRPIETIPDLDRRDEAATLRRWFRTEFLDALPD